MHALHLVETGTPQGQNWNLEELSAVCAAGGRYAFLLSAVAEPFTGGTGMLVAPVAVLQREPAGRAPRGRRTGLGDGALMRTPSAAQRTATRLRARPALAKGASPPYPRRPLAANR